jgi:hypothetical protein
MNVESGERKPSYFFLSSYALFDRSAWNEGVMLKYSPSVRPPEYFISEIAEGISFTFWGAGGGGDLY